MKLGELKDLAIIAGALATIYLVMKGKSAVDAGAQTAAEWWVNLTTDPVKVNASAGLPDGSVIALDNVDTYWVNNTLRFRHAGIEFRFTGERQGNVYRAVRV